MISTQATHYYTLLEALNKNTEEMRKSHNVINLKILVYNEKKILIVLKIFYI